MLDGETCKRREVGYYQWELNLIQALLKKHSGELRVKFKLSSTEPPIDIGNYNGVDENDNESTFCLQTLAIFLAMNLLFVGDGWKRNVELKTPRMCRSD